MARTALYTAVIISVIGLVCSQILGGYHLVETDRYPDLLEEVNGITHTGDFSGARLNNIKCAASQVVAGANYVVTGDFKVGDEEKMCTLKYSRDLKGQITVTAVDCDKTSSCSDYVITTPVLG